jgi:hypothetical protein
VRHLYVKLALFHGSKYNPAVGERDALAIALRLAALPHAARQVADGVRSARNGSIRSV